MGIGKVRLQLGLSALLVAGGVVGCGQPIDPSAETRTGQALASMDVSGPVALRTLSGFYVTAVHGNNEGNVYANRTAVGPWERWALLPISDGHWSLWNIDLGRYLSAEGGGGGSVHANRLAQAEWEDLVGYNISGSAWRFRTSNGHWLTADGGGGYGVSARENDETVNPEENTFFVEVLPFKYTQGVCRCRDGSTETCAVNPPSKSHDACNQAVKCACERCWDKGQGPGAAKGCTGK